MLKLMHINWQGIMQILSQNSWCFLQGYWMLWTWSPCMSVSNGTNIATENGVWAMGATENLAQWVIDTTKLWSFNAVTMEVIGWSLGSVVCIPVINKVALPPPTIFPYDRETDWKRLSSSLNQCQLTDLLHSPLIFFAPNSLHNPNNNVTHLQSWDNLQRSLNLPGCMSLGGGNLSTQRKSTQWHGECVNFAHSAQEVQIKPGSLELWGSSSTMLTMREAKELVLDKKRITRKACRSWDKSFLLGLN